MDVLRPPAGATGLLIAIAYVPIYLYTVLPWALWLGWLLLRRPPVGGGRGSGPGAVAERL